jgi:hypothetical protein
MIDISRFLIHHCLMTILFLIFFGGMSCIYCPILPYTGWLVFSCFSSLPVNSFGLVSSCLSLHVLLNDTLLFILFSLDEPYAIAWVVCVLGLIRSVVRP